MRTRKSCKIKWEFTCTYIYIYIDTQVQDTYNFWYLIDFFFLFCVMQIYRCMYKNSIRATASAESGYPCGAWLGRYSEIDVILITREVALITKAPGRCDLLCCVYLRCYTHTYTLFPIDRFFFLLLYCWKPY